MLKSIMWILFTHVWYPDESCHMYEYEPGHLKLALSTAKYFRLWVFALPSAGRHSGLYLEKYNKGLYIKEMLYCPFNILWKDISTWHFILNKNVLFWLTISYQESFVFSLSVQCFQIFTVKLILPPKKGLPYAISIVNLISGKKIY